MESAVTGHRNVSSPLLGTLWGRQALIGAFSGALSYGFWLSRPEWDPEMRLWRAIGDASLILLYATLVLGPLARLLPGVGRLLPLRRELGIWFGLLALLHTLLILNGWVRWDVMTFLGYEFVPQLDRMVRLDSGFGLANLTGLAAVLITLPLLATSVDRAIRALGSGGWKFLHYSSYIVFWLLVLHTFYFLFIHFTEHFHKRPPLDPNWFRWPFVALTLAVATLQVIAFFATVRRHKRRGARREPGQRDSGAGSKRGSRGQKTSPHPWTPSS